MPTAPRPFRQFVVKVHSRCDLACDHCYVYRHADQSWRGRPVTMSPRTFALAAARMAEHAAAHGLPRLHVVLHGGEPLLAGRERLRGFARELRSALHGVCDLDLRMQTNGLRLDDAFCAMLAEERIVTGVSLDGDRDANDRHRVRADGSGSHDQVVAAVRRLGAPAHRRAFGGLLCTVDVANDPVAVYRSLSGLDPPGIDFLLPHATWDRPPPRPHGPTDYADWLIAVHRRWTADGRPVRIRLFESITRLTHGGTSLTEALGLGSSDLLVVETDGAIEQADWLKTVAEGAPATGFHVARDTFDRAAGHPGILAQRQGLDGLSAQCRACPAVDVCGGGLYAHRFRTPAPGRPGGFDHPSVYCADLLKLIRHVERSDARTPVHGLSPAHFDALAAGAGGADAVAALARAQHGVRRVLLAAAHRAAAPGTAGPETPTGRTTEAEAAGWRAVLGLSPAALDIALTDPGVRPWALGVCESGAADPGRPAEIALSAAARTGAPLRLTVPLRGGSVHLPGLGRLVTGAAAGSLAIATEHGRITVDGTPLAALPAPFRWQPLRYLAAEGIRVALEDTAPYPVPVPRLTRARHRAWQSAFRAAWRVLRESHPRQAGELAAGLRCLVPLPGPPGPAAVRMSRHTFGAPALALPPTSEAFALLLIQQLQRMKLAALADLYDLLAPGAGRCRVAWRSRPQPLETVLEEAYVHLALAGAHRALARTGGARSGPAGFSGPAAARRAAYWHGAVLGALDTLDRSGAATAVGERLLRGMRRGVPAAGGAG
ncbi:FxsB family cyclophane-forming radical SAM/SPASM peptide maturase [Streptomyces sp. NPDC001889]